MPWGQLGSNIVGEGYRDSVGNSISFSGNGQTIIVGASFNDGNGLNVGHARVYGWNPSIMGWYQIGQDIDSEQTSSSRNGYAVAISRDGLVIAVSDTLNDGSGTDAGSVRVYSWNSSTNVWEKRGIDLDGEAANDQSGFAVSLNNNGTILAISSINNGLYSRGHVRVYNWNGSWQQLGSDIDGAYDWGQFGGSVSLSSDGSTIAVGGISINNGSGAVTLYKYESSQWNSRMVIFGESASYYFGCSVSLSADASIVAVGGYGNNSMTGKTRIFQLNYINNSYTQRGFDINGENVNDYSGLSVSLNLDGTIVAVGTRGYNSNIGNVRIYKWNQTTWELM